jgi:hypothetical protein
MISLMIVCEKSYKNSSKNVRKENEMIIYKVFEDDFSYGEYNGDKDVKYYISKDLSEDDWKKRYEESPTCGAKIFEIDTED